MVDNTSFAGSLVLWFLCIPYIRRTNSPSSGRGVSDSSRSSDTRKTDLVKNTPKIEASGSKALLLYLNILNEN